MLGDLVAVCRNKLAGVTGPDGTPYDRLVPQSMAEVVTRGCVRLDVVDRPEAQADVVATFARHGVSVETFDWQRHGVGCSLVLSTRPAPDALLSAAVSALRDLDHVNEVAGVIRVECAR